MFVCVCVYAHDADGEERRGDTTNGHERETKHIRRIQMAWIFMAYGTDSEYVRLKLCI